MHHDSTNSCIRTPLGDYLAKEDCAYNWRVVQSVNYDDYTDHLIQLTSQRWRTESEVNHTLWFHWLRIICPKNVASSTAAVYVVGGDIYRQPPLTPPSRSLELALQTKTVVADLGVVPNQPITFREAPDKHLSETVLDAYCQYKYLESNDPEWLLMFPMTKSVVRALDAVQEFFSKCPQFEISINDFVVMGGSKRARPAWLSATVDQRIIGIVSIASEQINFGKVLIHLRRSYGELPRVLRPYEDFGLYPQAVADGRYNEIVKLQDAYGLRDEKGIAVPKYIVNAVGDEIFCSDGSRLYLADIPGENFLRYVPNVAHDLGGSDAPASIQAFYSSLVYDLRRPRIRWWTANERNLYVDVDTEPTEVILWKAVNKSARDFRITSIGKGWRKSHPQMSQSQPRRYVIDLIYPSSGFAAYYVELVFDYCSQRPFRFTTDVYVVPNRYEYF